jgi:hypothetical protein
MHFIPKYRAGHSRHAVMPEVGACFQTVEKKTAVPATVSRISLNRRKNEIFPSQSLKNRLP